MSEVDFNTFFGEVEARLYNLVLDVPDFIAWYFHPEKSFTGVKDNFHTFPFVFYPDIKAKNNHGKWTGFGQNDKTEHNYSEEEGLVLHEIGEKGIYKEVIPIFIKQAELSYILSTNSRSVEKEALIQTYFGDIIAEGQDCIENTIDEIATPIILGETLYDRVNLLELKEETIECNHKLPPRDPSWRNPEICDNGIDDDGDGFIDEADCIPAFETNCGNGLDDDGDGLVDYDDPDCGCNCYRDCVQDHDYLFRHAFDDVFGYYVVTSESLPGIEKLINLRYDITRIDATGCPPNGEGECPFTTDHKVVYDKATRLLCDDDDLHPENWWVDPIDPNDVDTHCILDGEAWSAYPTGFFYGWISEQPFYSDHSFTFSLLNGYEAVLV